MKIPRLYAYLVGINEYDYIRSLGGCLNDVANIETWLNEQENLELHISKLTDDTPDKPTKAHIVKHFLSHLSQAEEEDIALFYFAGHGVQEETDIGVFARAEGKGLLESLVCKDSKAINKGDTEGTCLADKELRHLIHQISAQGAHVLVIFDCCHSGDATRDSGMARIMRQDPLPSRGWEGFIFHDQFDREDFEKKTLKELLPQGKHIHLAACRDVEYAWEYRRQDGIKCGQFTHSLIGFLRACGGNISYNNLSSRLTHFMRGWQRKQQTPQVYAWPRNEGLLYGQFLNGSMSKPEIEAEILYHPYEKWVLNRGAIHGLGREDELTTISIYQDGNESSAGNAAFSYIGPGYSRVSVPEEFQLDKTAVYKVKTRVNTTQPIRVCLLGEANFLAETERVFEQKMSEEDVCYMHLTPEINQADYVLRSVNDELLITLNQHDKPLVEQLTPITEKTIGQAYDYFRHIAQWEFVRQLKNSRSKLEKGAPDNVPMYPVEIKMFQQTESGEDIQLRLDQPMLYLDLDRGNEDGEPTAFVKFQIVNHSGRDLYVCLFYLSMLFEVECHLNQWLDPGESIWFNDGETVEITLDDHVKYYNWDGAIDYIKLLVSTHELDPGPLALESLPPPRIPQADDVMRKMTNKRLTHKAREDDWTEVSFGVFIRSGVSATENP